MMNNSLTNIPDTGLDTDEYATTSAKYSAANLITTNLDSLLYTNQSWCDDNISLYRKPDYASDLGEETIGVLNEAEVIELFDKIYSRTNSSKDLLAHIVAWTVRERHFSEKFLLKYYSEKLISKSDIMSRHRADILSGQYAELAVLLELN